MTEAPRHGGLIILLSFALAICLTSMPMPEWARPFRPPWATLVLVYWCLASPQRVGVGYAWMVGILLDVATNSLLGQHAMGLSIVAFIILKLHLRARVFPIWQQSLGIMVLLLLENLVSVVAMGAIGRPVPPTLYWGPALTGMLLWPWVFVAMRYIRRRFKVK